MGKESWVLLACKFLHGIQDVSICKKQRRSKTYADELKGLVNEAGLEITELSTHLQGQLVAVHPAYDDLFDGFAPDSCKEKS
jgi:sugar phosphate isomerase/epimerase